MSLRVKEDKMGHWESTEVGHHCGVSLCFQRVKKDPRKKR